MTLSTTVNLLNVSVLEVTVITVRNPQKHIAYQRLWKWSLTVLIDLMIDFEYVKDKNYDTCFINS